MKKDDISRLLQHHLSAKGEGKEPYFCDARSKSMKCWTALKIRTIILTLMKS